MARSNSRMYALASGILAIGLLIGGVFAFSLVTLKADEQKPIRLVSSGGGTMTPLVEPKESVLPSPTQLSSTFNAVATAVKPVVVNVSTSQKVRAPQGFGWFPFGGDDLPSMPDDRYHRYRYDDRDESDSSRGMTQESLGSGIIVDPRGYILTNNHVVEKADKIDVMLPDARKTVSATVVGRDKPTDLALIKIDAGKDLAYARFGDSEAIQVGDWVLAVGSPFNLPQTVTAGIISAMGRGIGMGALSDNFIQTDASINPGNSGGPLVSMRGEIIGVNTAIYSPNGGSIGIGFSIPSNTARRVFEQLLSQGKVVRGWLGVSVQDVDPTIARNFNLKDEHGAMVSNVTDPKSPAAKAGLKRGDVIVEFDGRAVESRDKLVEFVTATEVGKRVRMKYYRDGKLMEADATLAERDLPDERSEEAKTASEHGSLGVGVDDLTPQTARRLRTDSEDGAVVMTVGRGSAADKARIQPYDIIHAIDRKPVRNAQDLTDALKKYKSGDDILLDIEREGNNQYVSVTLD